MLAEVVCVALRSKDRKREIHLVGNAPTGKADMSKFGTDADKNSPGEGFYYVDKNNLLWAIYIPESFQYPAENVSINNVYAKFASWATFGGSANQYWIRNTSANVNDSNGF